MPGPFLAKVSEYWLVLIDLAGRRTRTVHEQHQRYGPVIRIAPNELSFSSAEALRQIYNPGNDFTKGDIYVHFGRRALFTMLDPVEHRERRKRLAPAFAMSHLYQMESLIAVQVRTFLKKVEQGLGKPFDMYYWAKLVTLDIAGNLIYHTRSAPR